MAERLLPSGHYVLYRAQREPSAHRIHRRKAVSEVSIPESCQSSLSTTCPQETFTVSAVQRQLTERSSRTAQRLTAYTSALCGAPHKADLCELPLWRVPKCTGHSGGGFLASTKVGSWPLWKAIHNGHYAQCPIMCSNARR